MSTNPIDRIKLRPYLTVGQIRFLLQIIAEREDSHLPLPRGISATLQTAIIKYDAGLISGSYTSRPRESLSDKLGLGVSDGEEARYMSGEMSEEEAAAFELALMKGIGS